MFYVHEVRNLLRASNFRTPARPAGFENFWLWSIGGSGSLLRHVRSTPSWKPTSTRTTATSAVCAKLGHRPPLHSITSSARTSWVRGRSIAAKGPRNKYSCLRTLPDRQISNDCPTIKRSVASEETAMGAIGAVFHPELIKLMKAVLNDAAATLPESKRTSTKMAEMASQILACAAKGERDPVTLKIAALLAVVECSHYSHDISPERRAV
jgi:hypothetical protein